MLPPAAATPDPELRALQPWKPPQDPLIGDQLSPRGQRRWTKVVTSAWNAIRFQQGNRTLAESWLPPAK